MLMTYLLDWNLILNYVQTILLFSQLLKQKTKCQWSNKWPWCDFQMDIKLENVIQSRPKKPRARAIVLCKKSNITHPTIYFNNVQVQRANQQKLFCIIRDGK